MHSSQKYEFKCTNCSKKVASMSYVEDSTFDEITIFAICPFCKNKTFKKKVKAVFAVDAIHPCCLIDIEEQDDGIFTIKLSV